eukprot:g6672.t1
MRTTFARDVERLGIRRLQLVELICELVHADYDAVFAALAGEGSANLMQRCLDTFFQFEWNNMLHRIVMGALIAIVERGQHEAAPTEAGWMDSPEAAAAHGGVAALCQVLFRGYGLLDRILQTYKENDEYAQTPQGCQKGFMGFLHHVCNGLVEAAEQPVLGEAADVDGKAPGEGDEAESNLIGCFVRGHAAWDEFVDNKLEEVNRIERTALGGDQAPPASPALQGLPEPDPNIEDDDGEDGPSGLLEYDIDDEGFDGPEGFDDEFVDNDDDDDDEDDDDDDDDDDDEDGGSSSLKA